MKKAEVYAKHKSARISPKKVAIVMDKVRGKSLLDAQIFLNFDKTKAAKMILKVLKSAEANAVNNNNLKTEDLYVSEIFVDPGRMQKWGKAGSKGRYNPQLRRYAHITVGLSQTGTREEKDVKKDKKEKKTEKAESGFKETKKAKKEVKKENKKDDKKETKKSTKKEDTKVKKEGK